VADSRCRWLSCSGFVDAFVSISSSDGFLIRPVREVVLEELRPAMRIPQKGKEAKFTRISSDDQLVSLLLEQTNDLVIANWIV
jgi:hypothetical protein